MTYYAVIDTNVIVSSVLKPSSIPGLVVELVNKKTIIPLISKEILDEYEEVLFRNKFGIDPRFDSIVAKGYKRKRHLSWKGTKFRRFHR